MTADGKIATANRAASSFGSPKDKEHLLELRATADAVMAGARTVDANPVTLGPGPARFRRLRLKRGLAEYNLRIVVSREGSVNPAARIFARRFSPLIILTTRRAGAQRIRTLQTLADEVRICGSREIDWSRTLRWLKEEWKVNRLLCEGGGELNWALFHADLVDELHLTVCPVIFGGARAPTIAEGAGFPVLGEATRLELASARRQGDEMFLVYRALRDR